MRKLIHHGKDHQLNCHFAAVWRRQRPAISRDKSDVLDYYEFETIKRSQRTIGLP